jgi:hypothetical protein
MTHAAGLITVWLDVDAGDEPEFNDWYVGEHIPEVVGLEGFVTGRRYLCPESPLRYLAWYETVDEHVEPGPHFQRIVANPTPWSQRIRRLYGDRRERTNFRLAASAGEVPAADAPWLCHLQMDVDASKEAAFAAWCDEEGLPALVRRPGVARARRYAAVGGQPRQLLAFELATADALDGTAYGLAAASRDDGSMLAACSDVRRRICRLILPSVHHRPAAPA